MSRSSRRHTSNKSKATASEPLSTAAAVDALSKFDKAKFDETVEVAIRLGIDPKQTAQAVRGAFSLPHGTGKQLKVVAFAEGADAEAALAAGAIEASGEELTKKIEGGWLDFDVAIAHPSMMRFVGKLGRVLGPQGKMPSPKSGTVTTDVGTAVKEFVAGKIEFRNDAGAIVHAAVGRRSFSKEQLQENIDAFLEHLRTLRPSGNKGVFIKRAFIKSTMSPSVPVAVTE
ncbi:MAG: 50S ribosomal protein L1 [Planctomycetota bacterium]|jgi:large subunit ribosomal protein L1